MNDIDLKNYIQTYKPQYISPLDKFLFMFIILGLELIATIAGIIKLKWNLSVTNIGLSLFILTTVVLFSYQYIYMDKNEKFPHEKFNNAILKVITKTEEITYAKIYNQNVILVMNDEFYYLKIDSSIKTPKDLFKYINNTIIEKFDHFNLNDAEMIQAIKELSNNDFTLLNQKYKEIQKKKQKADYINQQHEEKEQLLKEL